MIRPFGCFLSLFFVVWKMHLFVSSIVFEFFVFCASVLCQYGMEGHGRYFVGGIE